MFLNSLVLAHGIPDAEKLAVLQGGLATFLRLGTVHMLTGVDHLLFLLGIVFYLNNWRDVVRCITAFTLGHSLTLTLATLWHITANEFLVDAVIALSICYKAFDNLDLFSTYLKVRRPNLLATIGLFGMIHGFGLATRLQELPLGRHGLGARLAAFNCGIEIGQLLALLLILMVLQQWRRSSGWRHWSRIANQALLGLGFLLFLYQMHDYVHSIHPEHYQAYPVHSESEPLPQHDSL